MSQPSVAAYFNTRKRVAIDETKINRARKVLIVGEEGEQVSIDSTPKTDEHELKNEINDKSSASSIEIIPNKIVNTKQMAKKVQPKQRSITRKKINFCAKGQQNLQDFVTKLSSETSEPNKGEKTPPASPIKSKNAMDKVPETSDTSLNAIKLKLSRSSRLAELKASISRLNESHKKLKEIEKVTSTISVSPQKSPRLQNFKSIELEVNLSPQKSQSPQKLYLSPKKDITARKNLLNLLSPTKNTVALVESPSKKIYEETSKPALILPFKYRYLVEMFRSIDTVCQLLYNRKETITLSKLRPAVEKMTKRNMSNRCLGQIKHIYPTAFEFKQEKLRVFGTGRREEKWELVISPMIGGSEQMNSEILLARKRILHDLLLDKVKDYHDEFLKELDPPIIIPKNKITRWHPEFDIEKVPDVTEEHLPEPPEEHKMTSGQEVLKKAREMFNCNTRMEEALARLQAKRENSETKNEDSNQTPPTSILKGIPKALLEKVRQKQAAKALISMTRSADKEEELKIYSQLPELARLTRNLFVSEKKGVLPLEIVIEKLGNCYKVSLNKTEMEERVKLLAKELPDWIVLHNIRNTMFVKLNKNADVSVVIDKLENLTKTKSNAI